MEIALYQMSILLLLLFLKSAGDHFIEDFHASVKLDISQDNYITPKSSRTRRAITNSSRSLRKIQMHTSNHGRPEQFPSINNKLTDPASQVLNELWRMSTTVHSSLLAPLSPHLQLKFLCFSIVEALPTKNIRFGLESTQVRLMNYGKPPQMRFSTPLASSGSNST